MMESSEPNEERKAGEEAEKPVVKTRRISKRLVKSSREEPAAEEESGKTPGDPEPGSEAPGSASEPLDTSSGPDTSVSGSVEEGELAEDEETPTISEPAGPEGSEGSKRNKRRRRRGKSDPHEPGAQPVTTPSKLDPEALGKAAWKIYLAEISEEGVALVGDNDARELARRCFRLAELFLEERSRRCGDV